MGRRTRRNGGRDNCGGDVMYEEKRKINSSMDLGGAHKLLFLSEELLAVDGY